MRRPLLVLSVLLPWALLLLPQPPALAQDPRVQAPANLASVRADPAAHPVLLRVIDVSFTDATLEDALNAIADSAAIGISYSRDLLPDVRVQVSPSRLAAGAALNAVLAGTGLDAFVSASGNVAIAAARAAPARPAPRQPPLVQGRVLDEATGAPLGGVFVVLVDDRNENRAGVLSGADGRFVLRAPAAGRYALRYELIGYATRQSAGFDVDTASPVLPDVRLAPAAVSLASIHVAASEGGCRLSRDVGAETYRIWNEARKALSVAAWTDREAGVVYQAVQYGMSRDVVSGEVLAEQPLHRRVTSGIGRTPFISATADQLATGGFVHSMAAGGYTYYGVDAATLLAPEFLENYCFRAHLPPRDNGMVGLAFEPARNRNAADITGVLWLDRQTLGLRWLEYNYTSHPGGDMPVEPFGGRVDFRRLANGAWIVTDWWIRMPEAGPRRTLPASARGASPDLLQVLRAAGLTIREAGGAVRYVDAAGSVAPARATLSGVVYDSTRGRPLRGAVVFASGTGRVARTDAEGRFEMAGLPPAEYRVGFFHAYTDSLALPIVTTTVAVTEDAKAFVSLAVPAAAACPRDERDEVYAVGFVVDHSGTPAPGVPVLATWSVPAVDPAADGDPAARRGRAESRAVTDGYGRFILCGLPPSTDVELRAARSRAVALETPGHGLLRHDLLMR